MDLAQLENTAHLLASASADRRPEVLERTSRQLQFVPEGMTQEQDHRKKRVQGLQKGRGTCKHILNPAIWSKLPLELEQRIFAHLPLRHILRLRVLSKAWDQYVTGVLQGFSKVCAEVNPKLFGLLCEGRDYDVAGIMAVRIHDIDSKRWHRFKHNTVFEDQFIVTMNAGDGGLVCVVSLDIGKTENPVVIEVFNPLTKQRRVLPNLPHALSSFQPSMLQLVMDRESATYKVLVVGPSEASVRGYAEGGEAAAIYSSVTGQWSHTEASTGLIFGYEHFWDDDGSDSELEGETQFYYEMSRPTPCVYDCANGTKISLEDGSSPWITLTGASCYALVKDRLFVLHKETYEDTHFGGGVVERQRYCISEYQAQRQQPHWRKLQDYRCTEFENPPDNAKYHLHLYACNNFMLVTANNNGRGSFEHNLAWLYEFGKGEWQAISGLRLEECGPEKLTMFELAWDAIP
ncbi:hypothetical protein KC19_4G107500 [Ceratodon purpureus]|uniref:F-box domain-containing protein n=1 Tax=Ceratodon purpureus TaxID=3225 RepID=A0A8T0I7Q7_CERPU|nr:hypothetical protein KC19_4G107500 [Ceratodon purpureus]